MSHFRLTDLTPLILIDFPTTLLTLTPLLAPLSPGQRMDYMNPDELADKVFGKPPYEYRDDGPQPMAWESYSKLVSERFQALLDDESHPESVYQKFIEEHICLTPCVEFPLLQGGRGPLAECVVTQPSLLELKEKIPDFLYFTGNSGDIKSFLIEIERPRKRWFTQRGDPTAEFTQARNQLNRWRTWFQDAGHLIWFEKRYEVRNSPLYDRTHTQHYVLAIGKRSHIVSNEFNKLRSGVQSADVTCMTLDRLEPRHEFKNSPTIKLDSSGQDTLFRVLHIPPTFRIGPHNFPRLQPLVGMDDAIASNELISEGRKAFLLERLQYWNDVFRRLDGRTFFMPSWHARGE